MQEKLPQARAQRVCPRLRYLHDSLSCTRKEEPNLLQVWRVTLPASKRGRGIIYTVNCMRPQVSNVGQDHSTGGRQCRPEAPYLAERD